MQGKFKKQLGLVDLTFIGLGSIIGSGWLFASQRAGEIAGPAAWISWIIGAVAVALLGFVYAELGGSIPRTGGTVRYPEYSHGPLVGYLLGFASLIAFASVAGIEAEAMRQYADTWWTALGKDNPTVLGWCVQLVVLLIFFALNFFSVNLFGKANTVITAIKFIVPVLTIIVLLTHMKVVNFSSHGFAPYGFAGIEKAVATAGIIFAYLGFQQAVGFSGEAKNPQRNVPIAIVLAVVGSALLYVLLQISFVGALPTSSLANGWVGVEFTSPFANVAAAIGLGWLSTIILADAVVSPSGTANIYLSATARVIFAWARTKTFFKVFGKVDGASGVPRPALWLSLIMAIVFTLPFPSWGKLVGVVSSATVLTYILGPVSAHAFRRTAPNLARPFRLAGMGIISPISFIIASLIIYWSGWQTDRLLIGMQLLVWVLYLIFNRLAPSGKVSFAQQIKSSWWLIAYYAAMMIVSYLGSDTFGGSNVLKTPWDQIIVILISLGAYYWGVFTAVPNPEFDLDDAPDSSPAVTADGSVTM
ncbi:APC family permease [Alicyclobacillus fastidiosus]|uniref:APC family permease n=1 Tax=Alicyclobacillus fastidiosus TaxID=392011 RepID=A0ABY6ZJI1_9BACL|nr:APC family permease [Alicyclobacillus fastidiosus]WAH42940.1 APC family permease [Alicyclobacillus fastidiosus]GMA64897.1 aspartate:proton symporter [Alicyclobacillus fastidiosus]